ncbi:MAG: phosphohydrolase [Burkholderiaceae bacterium]|nr:phosphohydrolase [Burkholderiaceae bacterium]
MLESLLSRGMFVDMSEMKAAERRNETVNQRQTFLSRWQAMQWRLSKTLNQPSSELQQTIDELTTALLVMIDRDADKAIFQILRHDQSRFSSYGVSHSWHAAVVSCLAARRLGWEESKRRSLIRAALSMNISMIELQGRLACQHTPLTSEQREAIKTHPQRSAELLRELGVTDPVWCHAVEQHHETPDGKGYPGASAEVSDTALLLHFVDVFTAKLSARATRCALMPNQAARELFTQHNGHPMAAVLVKEFGLYPPGCFVKLVSGEIAIAIHRGENANMPLVLALTNRNGDPLMHPVKRDTSNKEYAVAAPVLDANVLIRMPWESLYSGDLLD